MILPDKFVRAQKCFAHAQQEKATRNCYRAMKTNFASETPASAHTRRRKPRNRHKKNVFTSDEKNTRRRNHTQRQQDFGFFTTTRKLQDSAPNCFVSVLYAASPFRCWHRLDCCSFCRPAMRNRPEGSTPPRGFAGLEHVVEGWRSCLGPADHNASVCGKYSSQDCKNAV